MPTSSKSVIFVSSVQKELAAERRALKEYVHKEVIQRTGATGRNAYYVIGKNAVTNPSNPA